FPAEQRDRMLVDRELLAHGGAPGTGLAAVHGHAVRAAVLVAVVVPQAQAPVRARDHPRARAVLADVERDPQLALRVLAAADVHHQAPTLERIGAGRLRFVGDDAPGERLPAMAGERGEEG